MGEQYIGLPHVGEPCYMLLHTGTEEESNDSQPAPDE